MEHELGYTDRLGAVVHDEGALAGVKSPAAAAEDEPRAMVSSVIVLAIVLALVLVKYCHGGGHARTWHYRSRPN